MMSAGLISRSFHGFQNVQEVECNGETLDSDTSLLYMVLYSPSNGQLIASVNVATGECLTAGRFSSCLISKDNFRQTKLRTLLVDMRPGESRGFGCNITGVEPGGTTRIVSRVLVVRKSSECNCWCSEGENSAVCSCRCEALRCSGWHKGGQCRFEPCVDILMVLLESVCLPV